MEVKFGNIANPVLSLFDENIRNFLADVFRNVPPESFFRSEKFRRGFDVFRGILEKNINFKSPILNDFKEKLTDYGDYLVNVLKGGEDGKVARPSKARVSIAMAMFSNFLNVLPETLIENSVDAERAKELIERGWALYEFGKELEKRIEADERKPTIETRYEEALAQAMKELDEVKDSSTPRGFSRELDRIAVNLFNRIDRIHKAEKLELRATELVEKLRDKLTPLDPPSELAIRLEAAYKRHVNSKGRIRLRRPKEEEKGGARK